MNFGYILHHYNKLADNPEVLENRAANMHLLGFDSIWLTDHILLPFGTRLPRYENITEAITTLAYLAGKNPQLNFGLSTLVLPLRDPILVAKQLSGLYYFMQDRLKISFGAGWSHEEFANIGMEFSNRGKRFNEQLRVIKALWSGEEEFKGRFYSYTNAKMQPLAPGIEDMPIYIAGNSSFAIERSLKLSNGHWHPTNLSANGLEGLIDEYSLDPSRIILRKSVNENTEMEEMVSEVASIGINYLLIDDNNDMASFENMISYVRPPMEEHP